MGGSTQTNPPFPPRPLYDILEEAREARDDLRQLTSEAKQLLADLRQVLQEVQTVTDYDARQR